MSAGRTSAAVGVAAACALLALPSIAGAARSGVTIHVYQSPSFLGYAFSPEPRQCADGRTVKLFKQTGTRQHPRRDTRVARTETRRTSVGRYKWFVHNYPPRPGRFYARVPATPDCQADNSKTIHILTRPNTKITEMSAFWNEGQRHWIFIYKGRRGVPPYDYRCKLDDQRYRHCPDGHKAYTDLGRGHHVFKVRAIGHNGKADRTPAKREFRV